MAAEASPDNNKVSDYVGELKAYIENGAKPNLATILYIEKQPKPIEFIRKLGADGLKISLQDLDQLDRYRTVCRIAQRMQRKKDLFYDEEDYYSATLSKEEIKEIEEAEELILPGAGPLSNDLREVNPFKEAEDLGYD